MTPPSQPTPGPWQEIESCQIYGPDAKLAPFTDSEGKHHPDYRTALVALVYGDNGSARANARLIAEAPAMQELLWALVPLVTQFSDERWFDDNVTWILKEMTSLLARIEGKETP